MVMLLACAAALLGAAGAGTTASAVSLLWRAVLLLLGHGLAARCCSNLLAEPGLAGMCNMSERD